MQKTLHPNSTKIKSRCFIDQNTKCNLIRSVVQDHLPIYQAAILHKIKYSTAKHILRNFSNADYSLIQRKRRKKQIFNHSNIIVDIETGEIQVFKRKNEWNISFLLSNDQVEQNQQEEILQSLSKIIHQQVIDQNSSFSIHDSKYIEEQQQKFESHYQFLKYLILDQHDEMVKYISFNM